MTHETAYDLLEEFVLGSLSENDWVAVESHLGSGCLECRARMKELLAISERLVTAIPGEVPPPELRARILSRAAAQIPDVQTAPVVALRNRAWFSYTAAAAIVALILWNLWLHQKNTKIASQLAAYQDATILLGQPGMEFVDLAGVDPNPQAFGKVVVDPQRGTGVVYMYRLPQTPQGMVYQLWIMREGHPTSAGTFTVAADGSAVLSLESVDTPAALASFQVTIEPVSGVSEPTGMMYLTGPGESSNLR